jgi:hypothetical protein
MVFARVPEELLGVEVSDRSQTQSRLESLTLGCLDFDRTVLDASVSRYWSQERASWCTEQPPLRWSVAGYDTSQLVQFGRKRRMPRAFARPLSCAASEAVGWCQWWRGNRSSDSQPARDRLAVRITAFMRCIVFVSGRKSLVCDHKNIACYRERTAITSPNRQRQSLHKKAIIWPRKSGVCRIFAGKYR